MVNLKRSSSLWLEFLINLPIILLMFSINIYFFLQSSIKYNRSIRTYIITNNKF
uniref:Uncharacterized protein n=1 Tax=uncultured SAR11 cluster bacterium HF4000_37C10 TaxID=710727 RepID=E0XWJ6_9PROT|nr:hypothetical protein [uncultured SAR11 cluster bacterium HF4000_37C10]